MAPIRAEGERIDRSHRRKRQRAVEMREQIAAAGRLVTQVIPERPGLDGDDEQIILSGEVAGGGLSDLGRPWKSG
ncbi:hypothetical protein ABIE45_005099 [Methylobacterium sp. OAE515]